MPIQNAYTKHFVASIIMIGRVFEAWAKLAQKWLVCVPLRIHLEPINAVSDNIIIVNCATGPKRELRSAKQEALWANGAPYELMMNTDGRVILLLT